MITPLLILRLQCTEWSSRLDDSEPCCFDFVFVFFTGALRFQIIIEIANQRFNVSCEKARHY